LPKESLVDGYTVLLLAAIGTVPVVRVAPFS